MKQISGLLALAVMMLAACSSTGTTAVHGTLGVPTGPTPTTVERAVAHGVEAPIGDVPWSEVGPGWMLAMWSPASPTHSGAEVSEGEPTPYTSTNTLYLVNPEGGRYALTSASRQPTVGRPIWSTGQATGAAPCSTTEWERTGR